jgi:signal transduction histidine kinase/CheY-like chemotaxis protein
MNTGMDVRRVLVASGEQEVIEQVTGSLDGRGYAVYAAYSHRDVAHFLRSERFAAAIIDARLTQRDTGEASIVALQRMHPRPPLLLYDVQGQNGGTYGDARLEKLDEQTLRAALLVALRMPRLSPAERVPDETLIFVNGTPKQEQEQRDNNATDTYWRDDQIRTLFALSRSLTEVLDLSEVLNRVVEAARHLTDADEGMILLPDELSDELYLRARVGMDVQVAENFRIRTQDTLAGAVYTTGKPALVSAHGPHKIKTEYFVHALLYVPILLNGIPLGVLGVNNREKRAPFSERHRELLSNLASYAAIAINNARTHGESLRRAQELKLLVDASQAMNATLSLEKTLLAMCESLARMLNVHVVSAYEVSDDRLMLNIRAGFRQARWRAGAEETISLNRTISDSLLRAGVVEIDMDSHPEARNLLRRMGAAHAFLLPVMHGETLFGVAIAYYASAMPDLNPARLGRVERLLAENAQILLGGTSERGTSGAFQALIELRALLEANLVEFAVEAQGEYAFRVRYAYGGMARGQGYMPVGQNAPIVFDEEYTLQTTIEADQMSMTASTLLNRARGSALLMLPLKVRGNIQGVVAIIDTLRPRLFGKREIDLARALLGQAGTAIDNAQLVINLENSLRELRMTQEKLIQSARLSAMGELAAAVAHQINNPLTTIVLDAELLMARFVEGSPVHESVSAIARAGKRASGVVRRLLSSARPDSDEAPPIPIDVIHSLQETMALTRSYFERAGIRLLFEMEAQPPLYVLAPPGALDDVWLNLLLNAHDVLVGRAEPQVQVVVRAEQASRQVMVIVSDNGPGIPDEIRSRIFEPFFTTKPHGEGTGLGLYICQQATAHAGGQISAENTGSGAAFTVRLPWADDDVQ